MPRPKKCRRICCNPTTNYFKPCGIPINELKEIVLERDEFDALKYSDIDKLSQDESSDIMQISRQTYGRILQSARKKVSLSIINGYLLKINN